MRFKNRDVVLVLLCTFGVYVIQLFAQEMAPEENDEWWEKNYETITVIDCMSTAAPETFTIEVRHEWSPHGADRFVEMVESGLFVDMALFRCVKDFIVQTGINGDISVKEEWSKFSPIPDDHPDPRIPFKKGMVSFAGSGPDSRRTSMFIAFKDTNWLGKAAWETPFGIVTDGFDEVVMKFYTGYGEMQPFNKSGVEQRKIQAEGNDYLRDEFPLLDYIEGCMISGKPRRSRYSEPTQPIPATEIESSIASGIEAKVPSQLDAVASIESTKETLDATIIDIPRIHVQEDIPWSEVREEVGFNATLLKDEIQAEVVSGNTATNVVLFGISGLVIFFVIAWLRRANKVDRFRR